MSRKVVNYKVVCEKFYEVKDFVLQLIGEGWQPFGTPDCSEGYVTQVMVKYEEVGKNGS